MNNPKRTAHDALKAQMQTMLTTQPQRRIEEIATQGLRVKAHALCRRRSGRPPNRVAIEGGVAYLYDNSEMVGWVPESRWEALKQSYAPNQ